MDAKAKKESALLSLTSFPLTFKVYRLLAWNPLIETVRVSEIVYFAVAVFYGFLCFVQEMIYFFLHINNENENSFLILTNNLPCAGFVVLTMVKLYTVYYNHKILLRIFKDLKLLNETLEESFNGNLCFATTSKKMLKVFSVLFMLLIWIFNLMPLVEMSNEVMNNQTLTRQLPYYMWYPFDAFQPVVFEICFATVSWGAFTCALGILTSDLLLCSFLTLICMQFVNLKNRLKKIIDGKKPGKYLDAWINDHIKLLDICEKVEEIFSFSILVNFIGSSIIICLAGFQTVVKYFYFNR